MNRWLRGVGIALLTWPLAGCSKNDPGDWRRDVEPAFYAVTSEQLSAIKPKQSYRIALIAKAQNDPYYREIVESAQKTAREMQVELTVQPAETAEAQHDLIRQAAQSKPNALIVIPIDSKQVVDTLAEAQNQGVPVVHLADEAHPTVLKQKKVKLGGYVGSENMMAGKQFGVDMFRTMSSQGGFLQIRTTEKNTTGSDRADGLIAANHSAQGIRPVVDQPVETPAQARDLTKQTLSRYPDLIGVVTTSDSLAIAAREALGDRKIPVYGFGGGKAGREAVQRGILNGTINCFPDRQGSAAVQMAVGLANGELKSPAHFVTRPELWMRDKDGKIVTTALRSTR